MSDYNSTARFLAQSHSSPERTSTSSTRANNNHRNSSRSTSPIFARRSQSTFSRTSTTQQTYGSPTLKQRLLARTSALQTRVTRTYTKLTPLQRILVGLGGTLALVTMILFLVYREAIFGALVPVAKKWRDIPAGWLILWAATFVVSFPPLIGYSSCVTLAGFVFGVWKGWLIVASATIIGSTASFLVSRYLLSGFVGRLTANDKRFAALALTLKHDGLKLLVMIRLCPLPYSLSNGAISTIPTVTPLPFMLATACAAPKLFLHVFVGSRLGAIAERGDKMDFRTKVVSYLSIAIGVTAGILTGWFMYSKTKARAAELEEEERANGEIGAGRRSSSRDEEEGGSGDEWEYSDDPAEREGVARGERERDGISMHTAEPEDEEGYRDAFSDDGDVEDAASLDKVFHDGDGEEEGFTDERESWEQERRGKR